MSAVTTKLMAYKLSQVSNLVQILQIFSCESSPNHPFLHIDFPVLLLMT